MTIAPSQDDDALVLLDDEPPDRPPDCSPRAWRILIVDDDEDVHSSTVFALSDLLIQDRPLQFLHAYSARQAREILARESDIAVVLLDVVMESEQAGLLLVRTIREELRLTALRIILRTGQPGQAPELEAIRHYDINDYRTKGELSRVRLTTSLISAIRCYEQLCTITASRQGLEKIIQATAQLFDQQGLESLAEGVLTQLAGLLGMALDGIVCAQRGLPLGGADADHLYVVGAAGRFAGAINQPLESLADWRIEQAIHACMERRSNHFGQDYTALYLNVHERDVVLFLDALTQLECWNRQLLEVFAANISAGFSNAYLFQRLHFFAYHDPLTGLLNRRGLAELIDRLRQEAHPLYTAILVDIDRFSDINDALGTPIGDAVLNAAALRLRDSLPAGTHVGRYSGDVLCAVGEFFESSATGIARLFDEPIVCGEFAVPLSVTLGLCRISAGKNGLEVLNNAGLALSRAKQQNRGHYEAYTERMASDSRRRLTLLQELRRAVKQQRLELHYQPKVDLADGRFVGAEALLRWRHGDDGYVPPSDFIPLAEQSGLILDIGEWVIFQACRQLAEWSAYPAFQVAINVSIPQFRGGACTRLIRQALDHYGLAPERLEVEVTESVMMDDMDASIQHLKALKELGLQLALDDFGTGFSSLCYLQQLPIDVLKVDRAFVREIGQGGHGESIAAMVVALGKLLGLSTVAEGIETAQQQAVAKRWGCDIGQGYWYSPALAPADLLAWLNAPPAAP